MKKIQVSGKYLYAFLADNIVKGSIPIIMEERIGDMMTRKGIGLIKIANIALKLVSAGDASETEIKNRIFICNSDDKLIETIREFNDKDAIAKEKFPLKLERLIRLIECYGNESIYFQPEYLEDGVLFNKENIENTLQGRSLTVEHPLKIIGEIAEGYCRGHKDIADNMLAIEYVKRTIKNTAYEKDFGTLEALKLTEELIKGTVSLDQYISEMEVLREKCKSLDYYQFGSKLDTHQRIILDEKEWCDICKLEGNSEVLARYDGKTQDGPWAMMCEKHFKERGTGLGLGKGQKIFYTFEK